ncbi:MAG: hypothetical protein NTW49_00615 [Bacteroidia bacterium]|nr:hypothetical protein [Bacteroidia bacterium]
MKYLILIIIIFITANIIAQTELMQYNKGDFRLKLALPYFNHLLLKPGNNISVNKFGFIGESIGFEYSFSENKFIELNFSFVRVSDTLLPFHFDKGGEYKIQYSKYFSLTNNNKIDRFTFGYGLNYSVNTWAEGYRSFDTITKSTRSELSNKAIGITMNMYYQISKSFNIGLIYRPTFWRLSNEKSIEYEHLFSFELLWRIKLNRK